MSADICALKPVLQALFLNTFKIVLCTTENKIRIHCKMVRQSDFDNLSDQLHSTFRLEGVHHQGESCREKTNV